MKRENPGGAAIRVKQEEYEGRFYCNLCQSRKEADADVFRFCASSAEAMV